jgi:Ring finger domain
MSQLNKPPETKSEQSDSVKAKIRKLPTTIDTITLPNKLRFTHTINIYYILKKIVLFYFNEFINSRYTGMIFYDIKTILGIILYLFFLRVQIYYKYRNIITESIVFASAVVQMLGCAILISVVKIKSIRNSAILKTSFKAYSQIIHFAVLCLAVMYFIRKSLLNGVTDLIFFVLICTLYTIVEICIFMICFVGFIILLMCLLYESVFYTIRYRSGRVCFNYIRKQIHCYKASNLQRVKCIICLEELKDNELISIISCGCDLGYHTNCIINWYITRPICPLCRNAIKLI